MREYQQPIEAFKTYIQNSSAQKFEKIPISLLDRIQKNKQKIKDYLPEMAHVF